MVSAGFGLIEDFAELLLDLGGCALQMRRKPRVDAFAQPQQLVAQLGELGAAALLLGDQRLAHSLGPSGDQSPGLAIGHANLLGRLGELAGILDRLQQRKQLGVNRFARLVPGFPDQVEIERRA